ncbi:MAG: ribonuclease HII, partial [Candidatus Paceibacterota bacterium]
IKGDEKEYVIALASIMAKVTRDRKMVRFSKEFPQYGFEAHKGYGTAQHYHALKKHGICPLHRKSFLKRSRASAGNPL